MRAKSVALCMFCLASLAAPLVEASSTSPSLDTLQRSITAQKAAVSRLNATSSSPGISQTLRRGSSGEQVRLLQEFLKRYGTLDIATSTVYFGQKTEQAVQGFQKKELLDPVGIVGPKTRARILALTKNTLIVLSQSASSTPDIVNALLSTDVGEDGSGVGSVNTFASTTRNIYAVLTLSNGKITNEIGYIRYKDGAYVDSAIAHPSRSGLRYMHFQWGLKPGANRDPGRYAITFYLNGSRKQTVNFTIQ